MSKHSISLDDQPTSVPRRFTGIGRLYGESTYQRFQQAHVTVVGLGGVGSWAAEALARSGIGQLTLIDIDHLAESNINRQIHALDSELGKAKVTAMAERIAEINPSCIVHSIDDWLTLDNMANHLDKHCNYVIDAIDQVAVKAALINYCRQQGISLVTTGGAGGRYAPEYIRIKDLAQTSHDPLAAKLRNLLRRNYDFPKDPKSQFGIYCVYSTEPIKKADAICDSTAASEPFSQTQEAQNSGGLHCLGYGSSVCVTATFGFFAASMVLERLFSQPKAPHRSS